MNEERNREKLSHNEGCKMMSGNSELEILRRLLLSKQLLFGGSVA